jgi:hypothetical protein
MIEDCVRTLARKHKSSRFVRLHYQDAEMEPAGVPAIIAYRGGDKFAGLVPIMEEMPDDAELSSLTLEAVMMRYVNPKHFVAGVIANVHDVDTRSCHRIRLAKKQFHSIRPGIARTSALVGAITPSCCKSALIETLLLASPSDLQYQWCHVNLHRGTQGAIDRRLHGVT